MNGTGWMKFVQGDPSRAQFSHGIDLSSLTLVLRKWELIRDHQTVLAWQLPATTNDMESGEPYLGVIKAKLLARGRPQAPLKVQDLKNIYGACCKGRFIGYVGRLGSSILH